MKAIREILRDSLLFMGVIFIAVAAVPALLGSDAMVYPWAPVAIVGLVAACYVTRRWIHRLASKRSPDSDEAHTRVERIMQAAWPEAVSALLVFGCLFGVLAFFGTTIPLLSWLWLLGIVVVLALVQGTFETLRRERLARRT